MLITLQPSSITDHISDDGTELHRKPYPFYADEDGKLYVHWDNAPVQIIGFVKKLGREKVDLWWVDAVKDLNSVVGMYLITKYKDGHWGTQLTAIEYVETH